MSEGRGLLTDREREALQGEDTDNYRYKTRTYVKRRLEKLEADVSVLENHEPDLLEELRAVVCDDTGQDEYEIQGDVDTSLDDPPRPPEPEPVSGEERERLIDEVPSSGELAERRADEILKMYDLLRERGEAEKSDLLGVVDVEATEYASEASVWSNMVKGRDTLRALPGVETPRKGMTTWRYTGSE